MASEPVIPVQDLLAPISEELPAGQDIREDASATSSFYTIKDARNSARAAERSSLFDEASNEADQHWRNIMQLAPDILRDSAKDLEVACWYTEALLRQHGFAGLRDGFQLILGLVEQYWDNLFPMPDEDGLETRVAPLTGLNGEGTEGVLIAPIRKVDITEGYDPGPYNYWHYQQALEVEKVIDEAARAEKAAKVGFTREQIEQSVAASSDRFFIDLRDDLTEALATYQQIGQMLDELCGIELAPPTRNITSILDEILGAVKHLAKYKLPDESAPNDTEMAGEDQAVMSETSSASTPTLANTGPIQSRQQAFNQLMEISAFFRKTEPHSPISYIIERAVKWGDMPLEDLIRELIPDSSARDFYGSLTGVKTEDEY